MIMGIIFVKAISVCLQATLCSPLSTPAKASIKVDVMTSNLPCILSFIC